MKSLRVFFLFLLCFASTATIAQSSSDLQKKKAELNRQIEALNKSLNQTSGTKKRTIKQVNDLMKQIRLREEKINLINSEIRLLDNQISDNTKTVHHLQSDLEKLKARYADMIRFASRNQNSYTILMFVFSSSSFNQAYMRMKFISQYSRLREQKANEIQHTQKQINIKIGELDEDKKEKNELLSDKVQEKTQLGKQKDKTAKEVQQLTVKEKQLSKQLDTRKAEAKKLDARIRTAIANEIAAEKKRLEAIAAAKAKKEAEAAAAARKANPAAAPVKKPAVTPKPVASGSEVLAASPEGAKLSAGFENNRGRLPWPVKAGNIVETFGRHTYGVDVIIVNAGIDIQTNAGASALAVFDGEVFGTPNLGGFYAVMIKHGQYITIYSNLSSVSVSRGQKVSDGQAVGTVMVDRYDNKTKLHFEVRKGTQELNPASWLANR